MLDRTTLPEAAEPYVVTQDYEKYTDVEHNTWKYLYELRMRQLRVLACDEYLEGIEVLGITPARMPVIEQLNARLKTRTDWMLLPVSGFLPGRTFFDLLAARIFPTTTYIRKPDSLDYTPAPDIFHDVFGHVPMHAHKIFADYLQAFSQIACKIDKDADQERLGRLFWYTVEFGLIRQGKDIKLYGSGVISSQKESANIVAGGCNIRDFDLDEVLETPVKVDELQPVLYAIDSFEQIYEATHKAKRLFAV
jgi:phenylalanine-4-hydroxylase